MNQWIGGLQREPHSSSQEAPQPEANGSSWSAAASCADYPSSWGSGGGGGGGGGMVNGVRYDFVFPVEMGRGSSQICWNRGDDIDRVAAEFATRNGVGMNELGQIKEFIYSAMGTAAPAGGGGGGGGALAVGGGGDGVDPAVQQALVQQVVDMGFEPSQAMQALQRSGWDVNAALQALLG
mmetsp:Transcript_21652/g.74359  ORF Transcript_21652/g.74359 Transcript_21652/m.74359 type:complete len:180 (-) Transcript_21652:88-627(-)